MPSRKQIRRQQKLKRHEYEEVYVDEQGRELDPAEAEELIGAPLSPKAAKVAKAQPAGRGARTIEPPSLRRTLRRSPLFFALMLVVVFVLPSNQEDSTASKIALTFMMMALFLPFSYFMDTMVYRSSQRRLTRNETKKP